METKTYNGWTNYETWVVNLWMDNDRGSQEYWHDRALNWLAISVPDNIFTKEKRATLDLADEIREEINGALPDLGSCVYADLLNSALSEVNWHEIARHLIEYQQ